MIPFEAQIAEIEAKFNKPGRFKELCQLVLRTPEGAELLYMLYSVAHPADHTFVADARFAERKGGWLEVASAFWRNTSSDSDPPRIPSPEP